MVTRHPTRQARSRVPRRPRWVIGGLPRLALAAATALVGLPVLTSTAQAHSALTSSDPPASSRLATPPGQLTLTFSDQINPKFVTIRLAIGSAAALDLSPDTAGQKVTAQVPTAQPVSGPAAEPASQDQTWTITYRVVSADGHPIAGSYSFTVAAAQPTSPATSPNSTPALVSTTPSSVGDATTSATPTPSVQPDAFGRLSGRENATGNRLPAAVIIIIGLPLLALAIGAGWWFRRRRLNE